MTSDARHTIGYCDASQAATTRKCILADARHTGGYCDARQAATSVKCILADARNAVWNNGIFAPSNQCVCTCFYYCVAVAPTIICFII